MLALRQTTSLTRNSVKAVSSARRAYSTGHGDHGSHEEHHDDHGHHEMPLAPAESIINNKTGIAVGIVALIVGYNALNSSYENKNEGKSFISKFSAPIEDIKENYESYRARVTKQQEIQNMMMFPGEKRTYSNLITSIDTVPGRYFPSGSNTQLNTIQNFDELSPRKTKESPFY